MALLGDERPAGMDRIVQLAYRHLGLDLVSVTEVTDGYMHIRAMAGNARSFGISADELTVSLESTLASQPTFTELLLARAIPNVIPDTADDPLVADLRVSTVGCIKAFIGVPLHRSDGSPYGALCGLSHQPDRSLDERDVRFLSMLAELLVPELDETRRKQQLHVELSRIIDAQDVAVAYQPIMDTRRRRSLGVEALARCRPPFEQPSDAFAAAYEVGLGFELERLMARRVWPVLQRMTGDQFLTLNLTPDAIVRLARRAAVHDDLTLDRLVVEMTEHTQVPDYDALRTELQPLRERGLRISVDDAGAGYASLRHVVELRPDLIKIDRSLVHGVADDRARRVAVSAFVALAMDLDALVVGEGVERPQDLDTLIELGVPAAQGFLLAMPSTDRRDLERWVSLRRATDPAPYRHADEDAEGRAAHAALRPLARKRPT